jgi:hypothetical protein
MVCLSTSAKRRILIVSVILSSFCAALFPSWSSADNQVGEIIEQLGNEDFNTREQAENALTKQGISAWNRFDANALAELEKSLTATRQVSQDPEVQTRICSVFSRIRDHISERTRKLIEDVQATLDSLPQSTGEGTLRRFKPEAFKGYDDTVDRIKKALDAEQINEAIKSMEALEKAIDELPFADHKKAEMKGEVKGLRTTLERNDNPKDNKPDLQHRLEFERIRRDKNQERGLLVPTHPDTPFPLGVNSSMAGLGNASGYVFNLTVTNSSVCPATVSIPLGTVFAPNDTRYQVMMIGEKYSISLKPGETATLPLFGYCLDPEKLPPAKPADDPGLTYAPLNTAALPESQRQEYAFFATVIQTGNDLSAADRYTTPLPPQESKKTVIQWTIWHVRKPDVYTQTKLEEEVTTQFKGAGADVADPKVQEEIRQGSSQIWASVNLTLKEARTRSRTDISRKAGKRDVPPVATEKNVAIPHSRGMVSVPEEMAKTVNEVVTVLQKANYEVGTPNRRWNKNREEMTIDVPAAGNKPAQQYVIDHQGFILSHRVDGKLVSRTNVVRREGVPMNITREEYKTEEKVEQGKKWTVTTTESVKKYVEVHPRTGNPKGLVTEKKTKKERKSEAGEMERAREEEEEKKEEGYQSRWWDKLRDEWKKVDLEKR